MNTIYKLFLFIITCTIQTLFISQSLQAYYYLPDEMPLHKAFFVSSHNAHAYQFDDCEKKVPGWAYGQQVSCITNQLKAGARGGKIYVNWIPQGTVVERGAEAVGQAFEGFFKSIGSAFEGKGFQEIKVEEKVILGSCHEPHHGGWTGCPLSSALRVGKTIEPLDKFLREYKTFLDQNPKDIVFIFLQEQINPLDNPPANHVGPNDYNEAKNRYQQVLESSGIAAYAHDLSKSVKADGSWPTIGELRKTNKRALIFSYDKHFPNDIPYLNKFDTFFLTTDWRINFDHITGPNATAQDCPIWGGSNVFKQKPTAKGLFVSINPEHSFETGKIYPILEIASEVFQNQKHHNYETEVNVEPKIRKYIQNCKELAQQQGSDVTPSVASMDLVELSPPGEGSLFNTIYKINKERAAALGLQVGSK